MVGLKLKGQSTLAPLNEGKVRNEENSMNTFWKAAPWISRAIVLLPIAIFVAISVQPFVQPAAAAAAEGFAFTSSLGPTVFRVHFAGFPLGCAAFLAYCLLSSRRTLTGLVCATLVAAIIVAVRIYGVEVDSSAQQSMSLVKHELVLVAVLLVGLAIETGHRLHMRGTMPTASAPSPS
jgi:hypothetical protein